MAKPEDRIVAKLLATSAVTDKVVARITPLARLEASTLPAITYHRISTNDYGGLNCVATEGWVHVQIDCWAEGTEGASGQGPSDAAWALAALVKSALNGHADATGVPGINYIRLLDERDATESVDGSATGVGRIIQDYRVEWYS